jgi:glycosyltransferase involved in cell wall biosynthesis
MKILTEYRIIKSQCPLWEECTQNIRYMPSLIDRLSQTTFLPQKVKNICTKIDKLPLIIALRLFIRKKDYDIIITGDFQVGLFYALLRKIFTRNSCPHFFLDLMLDAEQSSLLWRFKRWVQKKVLASVDCMLVFSKNELEYYPRLLDIPAARFRFLPYHTNITKPQLVNTNQGYIFSAGKSGRDYRTLIEAVKDMSMDLYIVSDEASMQGIEIPHNVKVYYNITYDKYLELLRNSSIVVIPLMPHIRSLGMVVMLEAMALGKPTIITRAISNVEYIKDKKNGYLVEVGDHNAIKEKIQLLSQNPQAYNNIRENALRDVREHWVFEKYVRSVLNIAQELINGYNHMPAKHQESQPIQQNLRH